MEPEKKSNGALVGLIIVIVILVIGGVYIWQLKQEEMQGTESSLMQDSDELNSLDADLEATDTNTGVDANTVY
jgi:flagellar basal body-associated protein FliL